MAQLNLKIITPEKEIYNETVSLVTIPTPDGEVGILPHHINLMSKVVPGELKIKKNDKIERMAVGEGFFQVEDNILRVLTDMAVDEKEIDEKAVDEAHKRAKKALEEKLSDEEFAETFAILERSLAQLKVKRRRRSV